MATIYCDFEAGDDGDDGSDWSLAKLTFQAAITAAGAGGVVFVRRTNAGTPTADSAGSRTITIPASTVGNPVVVYGCADGTTAEPPTSSDFETNVANQPELACTTGATLTITGSGTHIQLNYMRVDSAHRISISNTCRVTMVSGYLEFSDNLQLASTGSTLETINMTILWTAGGRLLPRGGSYWFDLGSTMTWDTTSPATLNNTSLQSFHIDWSGTDISDFAGATAIWDLAGNDGRMIMRNCKLPSSITIAVNAPTSKGCLELIACTSGTASGNANFQDYYKYDASGITENSSETRTGGADDGSTGQYSISLTPHVDSTIEGSEAAVKTQWMAIWLDAGAVDITAYITNDAENINEDDAWMELLTPNTSDEANHTLTFDGGAERLITSTTDITTDSSTWSLASDFPQKLTASVTIGYTGWAYARVCYAKRFASSPVPLYVDPLPVAA